MTVKKKKYDQNIVVFTIFLGLQFIYHQFAAIFTVTDYMRQMTADYTTNLRGTK